MRVEKMCSCMQKRQFMSEGREKCLKMSKFARLNAIDVDFMFFKVEINATEKFDHGRKIEGKIFLNFCLFEKSE